MLRGSVLAGAFGLLLFLPACSGSRCVDLDLDGYGRGCGQGPDCDDTNPLRNVDCNAVPPPDCDADPTAAGCGCYPGTIADCYDADPATNDVGPCHGGTRHCVNRYFGVCDGSIVPVSETCDGIDDDCDGTVDEGVISPCGGCNASCVGAVWGAGAIPFEDGPDVDVLPDGELTLARTLVVSPNVWVANTGENTMSRIDAASTTEVARYASGGIGPSRVAVDYIGDAFVTNEAFNGQSTVTKIAGDISRCIDRNVSMTIETSSGPMDVLAAGTDECVLFTVSVGASNAVARAIAVDGSGPANLGGDPWVGLENEEAVLHLDGGDGHLIERVDTPGFRPFGASFDARGILWLVSEDGYVARIDRSVSPSSVQIVPVNLACYITYSVLVAPSGELILPGQACDHVARFDPTGQTFSSLATLPNPETATRSGDQFWVSHTDGRLSEITLSPFAVTTTVDLFALGRMPIETIGTATDAFGKVWAVSAQGGGGDLGLASRVDPATGTVLDHLVVGAAPRATGDLTGGMLAGAFVPQGQTSHVFTGCGTGVTTWSEVYVDASLGVDTMVIVEARRADDAASLASTAFETVGMLPDDTSPFLLALANNGVVELRLTLVAGARDSAPRVRTVGLRWQCSGITPG